MPIHLIRDAIALVRSQVGAVRTSAIVTMALGMASLAAACGPIDNTSDNSNATDQLNEGPSATLEADRPSEMHTWTDYSIIDPLTDVETMVAGRTFRTGSYKVALEVGCDDRKAITYTATTFDENHEGAPLDWTFGSNGLQFLVGTRVDREQAESWWADKRRFSNQFRLSVATERSARGNALTMRFAMPNADATIFIDQADSVFRRVVEPCLTRAVEPAPVDATQDQTVTEPTPEAEALPDLTGDIAPVASENSVEDTS